MVVDFDIMAIGMSCPYEGYIKYFATYHIKDIPEYKIKREQSGLNTDYKIISHVNEKKYPVDFVFPFKPPSGSSALLGAFAAMSFTYKKIILCGCPLEGVNSKQSSYTIFRKGWLHHKNEVIPYCRSMSGWTKELLGEPTQEWLSGL
jgi:hypothetical protein